MKVSLQQREAASGLRSLLAWVLMGLLAGALIVALALPFALLFGAAPTGIVASPSSPAAAGEQRNASERDRATTLAPGYPLALALRSPGGRSGWDGAATQVPLDRLLAAPAAAPTGRLTLSVRPAGARVAVTGPDRYLFATTAAGPIELDGLVPGSYVVVATHPGHPAGSGRFEIVAGGRETTYLELEPPTPAHEDGAEGEQP